MCDCSGHYSPPVVKNTEPEVQRSRRREVSYSPLTKQQRAVQAGRIAHSRQKNNFRMMKKEIRDPFLTYYPNPF